MMVAVLIAVIGITCGTARANWLETFDGDSFDLFTWQFGCYPDMTKTFEATISDGPDDNDYLSLDETSPDNIGGSQFGVGIGDPDDVFQDVRVGATFNVTGEASWNYHGLAARISSFIDDGSITGAPGIVASTYAMVIHYEEGPANLKVELLKAVNLQTDIMAEWQPEVRVPGLDHAKSHYFELDVIGSDPVYITGSVYEHEGGPLLVRTPTFIDTNANDPWEAPNIHDGVFAEGTSGIFGRWEAPQPAGYHSPFDDVFSISNGPAAVNPGPADGATGVPIDVALSWIEAEFATGRELWLGKAGAMEKVETAPTGTTYTPGILELGQTYQWRVDQVGPDGAVTGHKWIFKTADCVIVDDFDSYENDAGIQTAWPHNISGGFQYVFLSDDNGNKLMRFELENQFDPYFTEGTRTFDSPQDWTIASVESLSLRFKGEHENTEHLMYISLEDAAGKSCTVEHPQRHACQSDSWRQWSVALGLFSDGGVDLTAVKKITLGLGDGTDSGQDPADRDHILIDWIELCPAGINDPG
jgi:hypothetical protein